jgi:hypothetical protein
MTPNKTPDPQWEPSQIGRFCKVGGKGPFFTGKGVPITLIREIKLIRNKRKLTTSDINTPVSFLQNNKSNST